MLYATNPTAACNPTRSAVSLVLIFAWATRLTHSYFRRESWKFGQQEDWRYTKMARENPRWWWLISFFAVGLAQQPMLVGISLPAYSIHSTDLPWSAVDWVATITCVVGLSVAYTADTQLFNYMQRNKQLAAQGQPKVQILDSGLWHFSRHPNYFGETLWWFGYGLYAVRLGQWYMLGGWLFNTIVLITVTCMTEDRMLSNWDKDRVALYREYKRATSSWIPLPKFR